jgi:hypothetical protein
VPPAINAATAGRTALEQFDGDNDGKLRGAELDKCPALKSVAGELDPKSQGVTAEMIENTIKHWQEAKIGRVARFVCSVRRNGKPLVGAKVKFVPESFQGTNVPGAEGTTTERGLASVGIPDAKPEGIALGFYRVEITKDGDGMPAKYNTETTLGIGLLHPVAGVGASYNLVY